MIKIEHVALLINKELEIKYSLGTQLWLARFKNGELMRNGCLGSIHGQGKSPNEALEAYVEQIKGYPMAFNTMDSLKREEFNMPKELIA